MADERGQEQVADVSSPAVAPRTAVVSPVQPAVAPANTLPPPREIGGPKGLEPTRYGDWERAGRCIDF
ncbi:MAG: succinate dehydrogenase assembly factor 4 [Gammaproteobacteria bacterium]